MTVRTRPNIKRLFYIELGAFIVCYMLLFLALSLGARGGPLSTDVTAYADLGIGGGESLQVYNRFFHIFLQTIFMKLAGNPLTGMQFFWGFIVSTTIVLTYVSARLSTRNSSVLHGILAVIILGSVESIASYTGIPLVDFTAMLMVSLFAFVYILSARVNHQNPFLIGLLGTLLYLCFKTKETALVSVVLLPGLIFDRQGVAALPVLKKRAVYLIGGLLSGIVLFALMSWIFLGDPLWGLRISEWRQFLGHFAQFTNEPRELIVGNWYSSYLLIGLLTPFLLYLISGAKALQRPIWKVLWLLPLALIVFLTLTVVDAWGFIPRFVLPIVPVVCFLAPQFLKFRKVHTFREFLRSYTIFFVGVLVLIFIRLQLGNWITADSLEKLLTLTIYPLALSALLALVFIYRRPSHWASVVLSLLILSLVIIPVTSNLKTMFITRPNLARTESLFYPFSSFAKSIQFTPDMRMYISQNIWSINDEHLLNNRGFAKNIDEVKFLFNVYFDVPAARENFALKANTPLDDILKNRYKYVLVTQREWAEFSSNPEKLRQAEEYYQEFFDKYHLIVLLKAR